MPKVITNIGSFKKGGTVKKTGSYKLHKGETVVPKYQSKIARGRLKGAANRSGF